MHRIISFLLCALAFTMCTDQAEFDSRILDGREIVAQFNADKTRIDTMMRQAGFYFRGETDVRNEGDDLEVHYSDQGQNKKLVFQSDPALSSTGFADFKESQIVFLHRSVIIQSMETGRIAAFYLDEVPEIGVRPDRAYAVFGIATYTFGD